MTSTDFARALVASLTPALPPGFTARVEGDVIRLETPDGLGASTSFAYLDPEEARKADSSVSETYGRPWELWKSKALSR